MSPVQSATDIPQREPAVLPKSHQKGRQPTQSARLAVPFAIASFLAVASGCGVAAAAGVSPGVWGRNAAAWVIGALLAGLVARIQPAGLCRAILVVTPPAFLLSLYSTGQSGVHRWIALGPLHWNVAFLCLPAATVALATTVRNRSRWTPWAALLIALALVLQPDASQATAFAAAGVFVLLAASPSPARIVTGIFLVIAAILTWTLPDPLQPVPEVEGILALAGTVSVGIAALCAISLAATAVSPLFARNKRCPEAHLPSQALSVYFLTCAAMPLFGAFPVPLLGMSVSPIIGYWLGIGTLLAIHTTESTRSYPGITELSNNRNPKHNKHLPPNQNTAQTSPAHPPATIRQPNPSLANEHHVGVPPRFVHCRIPIPKPHPITSNRRCRRRSPAGPRSRLRVFRISACRHFHSVQSQSVHCKSVERD